jgi:hypothetical protein
MRKAMGFWRNTELTMTDAHSCILQRLIDAGGEIPMSDIGWFELRKVSRLWEVGFVNLPLPGEPLCITQKGRLAAAERR